jgi:rod shape determining protein RodA
MVFLGWISIYAAVYDEEHKSILDLTQNYGRQLLFVATSFVLALIILLTDTKFFSAFAFPIYILLLFFLVGVLIFGKEIGGSRSWFQVGAFSLQPAEFAKFATNLAVAKYLSSLNMDLKKLKPVMRSALILAIPSLLIFMQNDTGSALVYSSFVFVLYREGLPGEVLVIIFSLIVLFVLALLVKPIFVIGGLGFVTAILIYLSRRNIRNIATLILILIIASAYVESVNYGFNHFLEPHQQSRINVLLGKDTDVQGAGYNVHQSLIAIGSGGFKGKGFLNGTQTKFNFVPEQSTDFIFCTVGEEWGFIGSVVVVGLFIALLIRLIILSERQRSQFSRIYGYGVVSILFFHFMVNIAMTLGLFPVIGIPLPYFSYGGSSLWSFTILLFIFIKLDSYRLNVL